MSLTEKKELYEFALQEMSRTISAIQSCTESDLASIKSSNTRINAGNASEVMGGKEGGKSAWKDGNSQTAKAQSNAETCVCGQDYIPCHERNAKQEGVKYRISRNASGELALVTYNAKGEMLGNVIWKGGSNCGGINK